MSLKKYKLQVLAILSENLKKKPPQLVPSTIIAEQMNMSLLQLQHVLKSLEGGGEIKTDLDLQYNLITQKGLHLLGDQGLLAQNWR
jgi:predicted transcriptional regulator